MAGLSFAGRSLRAMMSASWRATEGPGARKGARLGRASLPAPDCFSATVFGALGTALSPSVFLWGRRTYTLRVGCRTSRQVGVKSSRLQIVFTSSERRDRVSRCGFADARHLAIKANLVLPPRTQGM